MNKENCHCLIVIERGRLRTYALDERDQWSVGRATDVIHPDIRLSAQSVSREHGRFQNMDGVWFYIDYNKKNGTRYNEEKIKPGLGGRYRPVPLMDGDTFLFGGGNVSAPGEGTVWAMFCDRQFPGGWRRADTGGWTDLVFTDGTRKVRFNHPRKGTVVRENDGIGIYMGETTYLSGQLQLE